MHRHRFTLSIILVLLFARFSIAEIKINNNVITKTSAIYNTLTNTEADILAVQIFENMVASTQTFDFGKDDEIKKYFDFRKAIVATIGKMKKDGKKKDGEIDYGYGPPYEPPAGCRKLEDNEQPADGPQPYYFRWENTKDFSVGVTAIKDGKTRAECATALQCAHMIAVLDVYGAARLDPHLPKGEPLVIGALDFAEASTDTNVLIPGDFVYMTTPANYETLATDHGTKVRNYKGENAIYIGKYKDGDPTKPDKNGTPLYSGLGLRFYSEVEMRKAMRKGYQDDTGVNLTNDEANTGIVFVAEKHKRPKIISLDAN